MLKIAIYLSNELEQAVKRRAEAERLSEAEVVRHAVEAYVGLAAPAPRLPLFDDFGPSFSAQEYVDEALSSGFGGP